MILYEKTPRIRYFQPQPNACPNSRQSHCPEHGAGVEELEVETAGQRLRAREHDIRAIDRDDARCPSRGFHRQVAFTAAKARDLERRHQQAERTRPGRPAPPRHELARVAGIRPGVQLEVLLPEPQDFLQPRTLERIAANPDDFYKGKMAAEIAAFEAKNGGNITAADLAAYECKERTPLVGHYRGYEVLTSLGRRFHRVYRTA